jgi:hypothetical protein
VSSGGANGIRTRAGGLKGHCPWPLDDGVVLLEGLEPPAHPLRGRRLYPAELQEHDLRVPPPRLELGQRGVKAHCTTQLC